jgi:hypothetical protein
MSKAVVKLFKDPVVAAKATKELKSKGYKAEEIGILVHDGDKAKQLGAKVTKEIGAALAKLDVPEDTAAYYEFSASTGGILISVKTDEARIPQAQEILRNVGLGAIPAREEMWASSPAFPVADRMSATDPIDAKMTGDFRKY